MAKQSHKKARNKKERKGTKVNWLFSKENGRCAKDSLKGHIAKHVSKYKKQLYFPNKGFSVRGSDLLPPCLNKSVTSVCTCTESLMIHAELYFDILKHLMITWICFKVNSLLHSIWSTTEQKRQNPFLCGRGKSSKLWVICLPFPKIK